MEFRHQAYIGEIRALLGVASQFLLASSEDTVRKAETDLASGFSANREFGWTSRNSLRTKSATKYDKAEATKDMPAICATLDFDVGFIPVGPPKKRKWKTTKSVTQIRIFNIQDNENESLNGVEPVMQFHVDLKNNGQRGPVVHLQISEDIAGRLGAPLGIPRIPFPYMQPMDCMDLILAELFTDDWTQAQASMHNRIAVTQGQTERLKWHLHEIQAGLDDATRRTPISFLQNWSIP